MPIGHVFDALDSIIKSILAIQLNQNMSVGPSTLYSFGKLVKKSNYNVLSQDKKDIPKGAVGGLGVLQNLVAK